MSIHDTAQIDDSEEKVMYGFFRPKMTLQDIVQLEKQLDDSKFRLVPQNETETGKQPFHIVRE